MTLVPVPVREAVAGEVAVADRLASGTPSRRARPFLADIRAGGPAIRCPGRLQKARGDEGADPALVPARDRAIALWGAAVAWTAQTWFPAHRLRGASDGRVPTIGEIERIPPGPNGERPGEACSPDILADRRPSAHERRAWIEASLAGHARTVLVVGARRRDDAARLTPAPPRANPRPCSTPTRPPSR